MCAVRAPTNGQNVKAVAATSAAASWRVRCRTSPHIDTNANTSAVKAAPLRAASGSRVAQYHGTASMPASRFSSE